MQVVEMTINEVVEVVGVSEKTLYKDFKKCINKLEQNNITWEGKGKNRKFYKIQDAESNEQIAYDIFKQIAYNAWGFDRRTDIDKLLHYMIIILAVSDVKSPICFFKAEKFAELVEVSETVIKKYRKILIENKVIMPLSLSKTVTYVQDKDTLDKKIVDNDIFEDYVNACKTVANTKNLINKCEYEQVENLINSNKHEFKVTKIDKYIAVQDFKKELSIDKLYQRHKTEFTPSFIKNIVILDILVKAFRYRFSDSKLNDKLKQYDLEYIQIDISELHEQGLKMEVPF